jgi:hypothetical protein
LPHLTNNGYVILLLDCQTRRRKKTQEDPDNVHGEKVEKRKEEVEESRTEK